MSKENGSNLWKQNECITKSLLFLYTYEYLYSNLDSNMSGLSLSVQALQQLHSRSWSTKSRKLNNLMYNLIVTIWEEGETYIKQLYGNFEESTSVNMSHYHKEKNPPSNKEKSQVKKSQVKNPQISQDVTNFIICNWKKMTENVDILVEEMVKSQCTAFIRNYDEKTVSLVMDVFGKEISMKEVDEKNKEYQKSIYKHNDVWNEMKIETIIFFLTHIYEIASYFPDNLRIQTKFSNLVSSLVLSPDRERILKYFELSCANTYILDPRYKNQTQINKEEICRSLTSLTCEKLKKFTTKKDDEHDISNFCIIS